MRRSARTVVDWDFFTILFRVEKNMVFHNEFVMRVYKYTDK